MWFAVARKPNSEPLDQFIKREGGINACAARFSGGGGEVAQSAARELNGRHTAAP
jgi:hypothetical protein